MELKEFIKETVSAIAEATIELQDEYGEKGILINPPAAQSGKNVYSPDSSNYTFRHVRDVEFDVALTAGSETGGGAKAGIKVFSAEIGANAATSRTSEQVSRVRFSVPITLRPTSDEAHNISVKKAEEDKRKQPISVPKRRGVR